MEPEKLTWVNRAMGVLSRQDMQQRLEPRAVAPVIMVVDDEVLIRLMATDILHDAGFEVVEACSADEAVALLTSGVAIDLVFTDVNMPGTIDGLGLVAYMKEALPTLPVILTTGGVSAQFLAEAGAAAVVLKPYTEVELTRAVGQVLSRRHG